MINIISRRLNKVNPLICRKFSRISKLDIAFLENYAMENLSNKTTKVFSVYNPADGSIVGNLPSVSKVEVDSKCQIAYDTWQNSWKHTTGKERSKILFKMVNLISILFYSIVEFLLIGFFDGETSTRNCNNNDIRIWETN